jgi:carbon-monoxide dehydrogenase large subunit
MSDGIGARVARKEDKRFLTGKGKYTDDIRVENQAYAAFVRSPVAHAKLNGIDASAALAMEGVIAVHTGPEMKEDGIGDIITGWAITSKDGNADAVRRLEPDGNDLRALHGRRHRHRRGRKPGHRPPRGRGGGTGLRGTARDCVFADKALEPGAPQVHENVPGNLIFNWEIGDEAKTEAAMAGAAHVTTLDITNNRLSPNAMEPRSAPSPSTTRRRITTRSTPPARTPMWRGWSSAPSTRSRRSTSCA